MKPIPLSVMDLPHSGSNAKPATLAFWFEERLHHEALQCSLDEIAAVFYPARARLIELDPATLALSDFGRRVTLARVDLRHRKAPEGPELTGCFEEAGNTPDKRLLTATHVLSRQGSILIVSMSRVLGDATSLFDLLFSWSRLHLCLPIPAPDLDRSRLAGILGGTPGLRRTTEAPSRTDRNHRFVAEIAGELMVRHARELLFRDPTARRVTLVCPIDLRRVLHELPRRYFGNATQEVTVTHPITDVLKRGPGWASERVEEAIRGLTKDSLALDFMLVDDLRARSGYRKLQRLPGATVPGITLSDLSCFPASLLIFGSARCERALALGSESDTHQIMRVRSNEETWL